MSSYSLAVNYLNNIQDEKLKQEYSNELEQIYQEIEEIQNAENKKNLNPYSNNPKGPFIDTAKKVWTEIVTGDRSFSYYTNTNNPLKIPIEGSYCNCSAFVSWVLYEHGYNDFKGNQLFTREFYNTDWKSKYGWTVINISAGENVTSKIKPGDIVVRVQKYKNGSVGYGHIDIVASISGSTVKAYDCGSSSKVKHGVYPDGVASYSFFQTDSRPGKIIRVS